VTSAPLWRTWDNRRIQKDRAEDKVTPDSDSPSSALLRGYYEKRGEPVVNHAFRSKGFIASDWQLQGPTRSSISLATLPPFLRTLMVTDGTVTKSLEAYYWEPVRIEDVIIRETRAEAAIEWLDVASGESLIVRSVQLRGGVSRRLYASAFSIIRTAPLPTGLHGRLLSGEIGIGELIREVGIETYRELLEFGATQDMRPFGGHIADIECVYRSYRIVVDHRPAILVSECFPIASFEAAAAPA
jgi:chorismate-pyruvate lyase